MPNYEDFEIVVSKVGDADFYSVSVRQPCGGAVGDADSSFSTADVNSLGKITPTVTGSSRNFKPVSNGGAKEYTLNYNQPLNASAAETFGKNLSELIFKNEVLRILGRAEQYCKQKNSILRIRLDLSRAPDLAELPWEYLRTSDDSNFLCLDKDFTLVRYLQTSDAVRALKVVLPLRILVMASTPQDLPALAKNDEIEKIKTSLESFTGDFIEVTVLPSATESALKTALETAQTDENPFHVFHYIGHGAFDREKGEGVLIFEDDNQNSLPIGHEELGRILQDFRSDLRLVILNACEGARLSPTDAYSSVAAKIMQIAEIPAVIAMQYSVSDSAAIEFAKSFYEKLTEGENIEKAVDESRLRMSNEWATPVICLRSETGRLFDIKIPKSPKSLEAHYEAVKTLLPICNLVIFLGLDVNLVNRPFYESWKPGKGLPSASELCNYLSNQLELSTPSYSLAGLAKKLQLNGKLLPDEFDLLFRTPNKSSKLYEVLGNITKKITSQLPDEPIDPLHCSMLFVTTTYDFALENIFDAVGIEEYHTVCYTQNDEKNWFFEHKHYQNGKIVAKTPLIASNAPNEYQELRNKYPVILKLPGEIKADTAFAITEDDFFTFAHRSLSDLLPADTLGQINNSRHLYLGYDLQNWTLRLLWNRICENQSPKKKESSYAVIFDEKDDPNASFWSESKVKFATAQLEDYVAGLEECVLKKLP